MTKSIQFSYSRGIPSSTKRKKEKKYQSTLDCELIQKYAGAPGRRGGGCYNRRSADNLKNGGRGLKRFFSKEYTLVARLRRKDQRTIFVDTDQKTEKGGNQAFFTKKRRQPLFYHHGTISLVGMEGGSRGQNIQTQIAKGPDITPKG